MVGTIYPLRSLYGWCPGAIFSCPFMPSGLTCFLFIIAKRLVPLMRAESDPRFNQPLTRLKKSSSSGWDNGSIPRYKFAGILQSLYFWGFILLGARAFSVLIVGVSEKFVMPGFSGRTGQDLRCHHRLRRDGRVPLHGGRRCSPTRFQACPVRSGCKIRERPQALMLSSLLGSSPVLMVADGLFAASKVASELHRGQPAETLAVLSLAMVVPDGDRPNVSGDTLGASTSLPISFMKWLFISCFAIALLESSSTWRHLSSAFTSPSWIAGQ